MFFKKNKFYTMIAALALMMLCGCRSTSESTLLWSCNNGDTKFDCSYGKFSGIETSEIMLDEGKRIDIDYEVQVLSGSLELQVRNPADETIWKTTAVHDTEDDFSLEADSSGIYQIVVLGSQTEGFFSIKWEISQPN